MKKMNIFKKVMCGAIALVLTVMAAPLSVFNVKAEEKEILDVYLIAGQSNATGYALNANLTCDEAKQQEYKTGYSNVWYHGNGDSNSVTEYNKPVQLGQGASINHVGAEVGMAEIISANEPNRQSVIIKHARGSSYLIDNQDHPISVQYGNWCPPSMRTSSAQVGITGKMYDQFVALVEEAVAHYQSEGYQVVLRGTFWMQGEAENGAATATQYATHLKALITDLREDFKTVFDNDVTTAPFIIGKIAPTFAGGGAGIEHIRQGQDMVASATGEYSVNKAYTIETEDYIIVDPVTNNPAPGCHDRYHFSADDIISIGHDVAEAALKYSVAAVEVVVQGEGSADVLYYEQNGSPVTITFTPDTNNVLKKVTANGVDVTASLVGNAYTVTETEKTVKIIAEFEEAPKFAVKLTYDKTNGSVALNKLSSKYYVGQVLYVTVTPKSGYTLESVSFNGEALTAESNGKYKIIVVDGENEVEVLFKSSTATDSASSDSVVGSDTESGEQESTDNGSSGGSSGGCGSAMSGMGALAYVAIAAGVFAVKKNKRK